MLSNNTDCERELRRLLVRVGCRQHLRDDFSAIDYSVIDKSKIADFVDLIQAAYEIEIRDDELVVENFSTVHALASFIRSKQSFAMTRKRS